MRGVYVSDFGERNNVRTYRVNGTKEDLKKIVQECRDENAEFADEPKIESCYRSDYTVLLRIKVKVAETKKSKTT